MLDTAAPAPPVETTGTDEDPVHGERVPDDPVETDPVAPAAVDGAMDDATVAATVDEDAPRGALARAVASVRAHASVADAMRLVGAALLVTSLSRFLLSGVELDNDLQRFVLLLGQTALFTGAGFAVARLFDDARGARLLFAVALLSVPAGLAVLGAMLYSLAPLDPSVPPVATFWPTGTGALDGRDLPAFARWHVGSARETAIAAAAAALVLLPTTFFALAVLARGSAVRIGIASLLAGAFLLVPVRDPSWTGLLVLGSGLVAALALRGLPREDAALRTLEGRFARLLPFVPALVIGARTLVADSPDPMFVALSGAALLVLSRALLRAVGRASRLGPALFPIGAVGAALVGAGLYALALPVVPAGSAGLVGFAAAGAALLVELGRHVEPGRTTWLVESVWAFALLGHLLFEALAGGVAASAPPVVAGASAVVALALWRGRPWLTVAGSLVLAAGLAGVGVSAFEWMSAHGWQSLVGLGLAAVVGASMVQRHGPSIAARARGPSRSAGHASDAG